ncbi:MAG: hypothetical protein JSV49_08300 [Thermoplasmata archaeon]|nr:MAG: hypothetical protein JSV49_08300 [Thermoplasmata archaeon]
MLGKGSLRICILLISSYIILSTILIPLSSNCVISESDQPGINSRDDSNEIKPIWWRTIVGFYYDAGEAVLQTSDGGFIIIGRTRSFGNFDPNVWLIKTDSSGVKQWDRVYGSNEYDDCSSILQTDDEGYIIAGSTYSNGMGMDHHGPPDSDLWLIKTDSNGEEKWNKSYGGRNSEFAPSFSITNDGGYILAGATTSYGIESYDIEGLPCHNLWLLKTNSEGEEKWNRTFGGKDYELGRAVFQTPDLGYIIFSEIISSETYESKIWLIKTNETGYEQWNRTLGGQGYNHAFSIKQTSDGGFIFVGSTKIYAADTTDLWLIKVNSTGIEQWNRTYGGDQSDYGRSIEQISDGGFIITGATKSFYGNSNLGSIWLLKIDSQGDEIWSKTFGPGVTGCGKDVIVTSDGHIIITGYIECDCSIGNDIFIMKTDRNGGGGIGFEEYNEIYCDFIEPEGLDTVSGIINLNIEAFAIFDGVAIDDGIKSVEIRFNRGSWLKAIQVNTSENYWQYNWDTISFSDGEHVIYVRATDGIIYYYSHVVVIVDNILEADENRDLQLSWITFRDKIKRNADYVLQIPDDGYILTSNIKMDNSENWDIWLIKIDSKGNVEWNRSFGGTGSDYGLYIIKASDGGYCILGSIYSFTPDCKRYIGTKCEAIWVIKTDADGIEQWNRSFPGNISSEGKHIQQTTDGGYIVLGEAVSNAALDINAWLIKLDGDGNEQWNRTLGGAGHYRGEYVEQTSDGGYIISGSKDKETTYGELIWLIKTDSKGFEQWNKTFNGEIGNEVHQTSDGGYIIVGQIYRYSRNYDIILIKTSSDGEEEWNRTLGYHFNDRGSCISQTSDGGYVIGGTTDKNYAGYGYIIYVIKTDHLGEKEWDITLRGGNSNSISIQEISNGSYILVGRAHNLKDGGSGLLMLGINYNISFEDSLDDIETTDDEDSIDKDEESESQYPYRWIAILMTIIILIIIIIIVFIIKKRSRLSKR